MLKCGCCCSASTMRWPITPRPSTPTPKRRVAESIAGGVGMVVGAVKPRCVDCGGRRLRRAGTGPSGLPAFSQNGRHLTVNLPVSANRAPPGFYLLFALDAQGVPSKARVLRLGA
ncbi:galactose oxidase-like domain-containing protein [Ideonella sp.]|uniref:galactose oxidase-like domain-containing protein n=1 Tax=Ideonella sp. TaxID=1929293 RepID=UPI0035AF4EE4